MRNLERGFLVLEAVGSAMLGLQYAERFVAVAFLVKAGDVPEGSLTRATGALILWLASVVLLGFSWSIMRRTCRRQYLLLQIGCLLLFLASVSPFIRGSGSTALSLPLAIFSRFFRGKWGSMCSDHVQGRAAMFRVT
jgi:hypothetical protein